MVMNKHLQVPSHEVAKHVVVAKYDYSKHGGAVGDITLDDSSLPLGAIITRVLIDAKTALTSGGAATIAVKSASAADLLGATAVASWTGLIDGIPVNTAATSIKLAADAQVKLTVAVAALTAGIADVYVEYVMPA